MLIIWKQRNKNKIKTKALFWKHFFKQIPRLDWLAVKQIAMLDWPAINKYQCWIGLLLNKYQCWIGLLLTNTNVGLACC